jgi:hypothetical protein
MKVCLRYLVNSTKVHRPGWGDCRVCIPHEDNKYCAGYKPVEVQYREVKDEESGKTRTDIS